MKVPTVVKPPSPLMSPEISNPPVLPKSNVVIPISVTGPEKELMKLLPPVMVAPFKVMGFFRCVISNSSVAKGLMVTGPVPNKEVTSVPVAKETFPALRTVPPV